jgi:phytol kinase
VWLEPFFSNPLYQDLVATVITFAIALTWLRVMDTLAHRGLIEQRLSRKIIHIGTGPLFVICWNFFSASLQARFLAALVPLAITFQFFLVGIGVMQDQAAVEAMTRTGDRREILRGPLFYGIVFVICTLLFWRQSPVGIVALMLMCGGDGLADIVGRRWGKARLPFNERKSWIGSTAMFLGGWVFALGFVVLFNGMGVLEPALDMRSASLSITLIALAATIVEALPLRDIDNLTTTAMAVLLGLVLL